MITSKNLKELKLDAIAAAIDSVDLMEGSSSCNVLYNSGYREYHTQDKNNAHIASRKLVEEYREFSGAYSDRTGFDSISHQDWLNLSREERYSLRIIKLKAFYYRICNLIKEHRLRSITYPQGSAVEFIAQYRQFSGARRGCTGFIDIPFSAWLAISPLDKFHLRKAKLKAFYHYIVATNHSRTE